MNKIRRMMSGRMDAKRCFLRMVPEIEHYPNHTELRIYSIQPMMMVICCYRVAIFCDRGVTVNLWPTRKNVDDWWCRYE